MRVLTRTPLKYSTTFCIYNKTLLFTSTARLIQNGNLLTQMMKNDPVMQKNTTSGYT